MQALYADVDTHSKKHTHNLRSIVPAVNAANLKVDYTWAKCGYGTSYERKIDQ